MSKRKVVFECSDSEYKAMRHAAIDADMGVGQFIRGLISAHIAKEGAVEVNPPEPEPPKAVTPPRAPKQRKRSPKPLAVSSVIPESLSKPTYTMRDSWNIDDDLEEIIENDSVLGADDDY